MLINSQQCLIDNNPFTRANSMPEEIALSVTDPLFKSLRIRNTLFSNRIMSTSHACGLEEDGGMPGETY